jgi:hypothetical protein
MTEYKDNWLAKLVVKMKFFNHFKILLKTIQQDR